MSRWKNILLLAFFLFIGLKGRAGKEATYI